MPDAPNYLAVLSRIANALERPPVTVIIHRMVDPEEAERIRQSLQLQAPDRGVTVIFANLQVPVADTGPLPYVGLA